MKLSNGMTISRDALVWYGLGFIWCIFMGITAISIGFGALYPPLNLIAKPFVCPQGEMTYQQRVSYPMPGTTLTQLDWYCVDHATETTTALDVFQVAVPAGIIDGLVLAAVVLIGLVVLQRGLPGIGPNRPARANRSANRTASPGRPRPAAPPGESLARMQELERLHSAHLISEAEYRRKRDEILKDL